MARGWLADISSEKSNAFGEFRENKGYDAGILCAFPNAQAKVMI